RLCACISRSSSLRSFLLLSFFFFTATASSAFYTLSLHDALPIFFDVSFGLKPVAADGLWPVFRCLTYFERPRLNPEIMNPGFNRDRKSTRLNSSHVKISYAVFCLKKKTKNKTRTGSEAAIQRVSV